MVTKEANIFTHPMFGTLKIYIIDEKEYFPATECAKILGYTNPEKAIRNHCKVVNEMDTPSAGGIQKTRFITEGDLYRLIVRSKLPAAERFEKWVMDEVLPQIRKTEGYIPVKENESEFEIMARAVLIADKTISQLKPKAEAYDKFLNSEGYVSMNKAAKGLKIGRNKMMAALRNKGIIFKDGYDNIAYQRYINSDYFAVNYVTVRDGKIHATTRVSPKGVDYIHKLLSHDESHSTS